MPTLDPANLEDNPNGEQDNQILSTEPEKQTPLLKEYTQKPYEKSTKQSKQINNQQFKLAQKSNLVI